MRRLLYEAPTLVHRLLEKLSEATGSYLAAQVEAGATAVQLFDTWAGLLSPEDYREFALPYEKKVLSKAAQAGAPTLLYVNGCSHLLSDLAQSGANLLSIDWRLHLREARDRLGAGIGLQGNLEPSVLFASPAEVRKRTRGLLESMSGDRGYIFNLGHGILPETPLESVEALVETVKGMTKP